MTAPLATPAPPARAAHLGTPPRLPPSDLDRPEDYKEAELQARALASKSLKAAQAIELATEEVVEMVRPTLPMSPFSCP